MPKETFTLHKQWGEFIQEKLHSGQYDSASALIEDSLRLFQERECKLKKLQAALIEGEQSGSAGVFDIESIKQKARDKAAGDHPFESFTVTVPVDYAKPFGG